MGSVEEGAMRVSVPKFSVQPGNIVDHRCEVIILKYAQGWYGADAAVARKLELYQYDGPEPGKYRLERSNKRLSAANVYFEGLPSLRQLTYSTVHKFGRESILKLHSEIPRARDIAMTLHGVSVGLDEREAFLSQLAGVVSALREGALPDLKNLTFVELNPKRASRIAQWLEENYPEFAQPPIVSNAVPARLDSAASTTSTTPPPAAEKAHVFVAMPFTEGMEDVFIFGIQTPVQNAGLLCERVDMAVFSGDILDRIKSRIETASLVIADLTTANANVYLEVGYAWGKKVDTLLLCRNVDDLKFDVRGQRCLIYSSINDLHKKLSEELRVRVPVS